MIRPSSLLVISLVASSDCSHPPARAPVSAQDTVATPARVAFAITSPKAGDTLIEGHTYVVRWMAPDTMRINLGVAMGGKDRGMLVNDVTAAPDSLVWTVPDKYVTGFGPASSDQMRLRMENTRNAEQWTEMGPFTIMGVAAVSR